MDFIKEHCSKNKNIFIVLISVLIVFIFVLSVSGIVGVFNKIKEGKYIGQEIETKNTITVSDTGEIYAKPDLGIAVFSVKTEKNTVAQAMTENTQKMNKIISSMKNLGVEEKDLKTTAFNIYPRYNYLETGTRILAGYEITQSLQVKIRDLEKIGDIVQAATDAGSNQIGDLSFTIDNEDAFKKQAREEAINKAKAKAKELADQLGVDLVRIVGFYESGEQPIYYDTYSAKEAIGIGGGGAPQIETGENKISVSVSITYEIN
ncbi:MAG: SIMPL domain-containing protein [Patescibacteria group bacterium]|nr:SIMPL domain-containing protein [Patescibacteria group bacterium]